MLNQE